MGTIITFDAARKNLAAIRDFVETRATEAGADTDMIYEITAAVDEAATNIIIHGYQDKGGEMEVEADIIDNMFVIRLRDHAPEFDPTTVPPPDLSIPLEERPLGGMGFHIIRKYTTRVEYKRLPGGGNELSMFRQIH